MFVNSINFFRVSPIQGESKIQISKRFEHKTCHSKTLKRVFGYFSYLSVLACVLSTQKKRLIETVLFEYTQDYALVEN